MMDVCLLIIVFVVFYVIMRKWLLIFFLKSKVKDTANSHNHEPIALVTALSKLIEKQLLHRVEVFLQTLDNRFSYKKGHGAKMLVCGHGRISLSTTL